MYLFILCFIQLFVFQEIILDKIDNMFELDCDVLRIEFDRHGVVYS